MHPHILATGQRFCADQKGRIIDCSGTGQDAEFAPGLPWPEPRFEVLDGDATVLDRLTGLTWLRNANVMEFPLDWESARIEIERLNQDGLAGRDDWRLPGRRELFSLISFQEVRPALLRAHPFENVFQGWYWSADSSARYPANAWHVHLTGGRMFWGTKTGYELVWPVCGASEVLPDPTPEPTGRSAPWPNPRFEADGEVVRDRLTSLEWSRSADLAHGPAGWEQAFETVAAMGPGWRLPTIRELESLADISTHSPALPAGHPFTDTREAYWSATNSAFEPDWAMCFYLHKGAVGVGYKGDEGFHVWAVRRQTP